MKIILIKGFFYPQQTVYCGKLSVFSGIYAIIWKILVKGIIKAKNKCYNVRQCVI